MYETRISVTDLGKKLGRYHQCCKDGYTYWVYDNILYSCPTNTNGTIDFDERGCVSDYSSQAMEYDEMIEIRNHVLSKLIS